MNRCERKTMKRNLLTSALCLMLLLLMLLSSTLAWFTDSKGNVNVMTAGKIGIDQVETFEQKTYIMPNVPITKNVVVKNTGNQAAYVRTLFAFEDSEDGMVLSNLILTKPDSVQIVIPGVTDTTTAKVQFTVTKDGVTTLYTVGYYIHEAALAVEGANSSINPLQSITLNPAATNAWHETVGATYEVIVLSQATQVAGMDGLTAAQALNTAFNPIDSANCAVWFDVVLNDTADTVAPVTP